MPWPSFSKTKKNIKAPTPRKKFDDTVTTRSQKKTKKDSWEANRVVFNPKISPSFTNNYGKINMISFLCSIWSRLAYMKDHDYLGYYEKIFGPIIPSRLMKELNNGIKMSGVKNIVNDGLLFGLKKTPDKFGLKVFKNDKPDFGGRSLEFLPWAKKVNIALGEERKSATDPNCSVETPTFHDGNIIFISIATSNYG